MMHQFKITGTGFIAMHHPKPDARLLDLAALLTDVLAVFVVHRRQIVIKAAPAPRILPVILHIHAREPIIIEGMIFGFNMKIDVCR